MPDVSDRQLICRATSDSLEARLSSIPETTALVGFDGFVDEICGVVETRDSATDFTLVPTIARLGEKIAAAAGQSSNYEIVVRHAKIGGNGPIMAHALASFGLDVTYVGSLGYPDVDPVFSEFSRRADLRSIAPAAHTDALEFGDGKLMLGKLEPLNDITWENLLARLGAETFEHLLGRSRLIGLVNWTMIPQMSRIWARLIKEVFPNLPESRHGRRSVFIDLADPEKRRIADLNYALKLAGKMQEFVDVTLGMNLKEATQVCRALDLPARVEDIEATAAVVREALGLACCVVHPRTGGAAATAGERATFMGPFVKEPKISTGAGDHFNAGFSLGRVLGLPLDQSLCCGVATSGHYVRTTHSPSAKQLIEFTRDLPDPE